MTDSKENLKKLKELCEALDDRDRQLKINAKTLWVIIERVQLVKKQVLEISSEDKTVSDALDGVAEALDGVSELVEVRGCKPALEDDHE